MAAMFGFVWGAASLIGSFALLLGAVVFVHEFGHFFVARRCGVKVEVFSIGMGPELFGRTDRRGARWRLSAIPIGGYVRFAGDRNAASASDTEALAALPEAERRLALAGQPLPARAAIVAAGPIANLVMAVVVLSGLAYFYGDRILAARIDAVVAGSPAEQAGFAPGDVIEASTAGRSPASTTSSRSSACGPAKRYISPSSAAAGRWCYGDLCPDDDRHADRRRARRAARPRRQSRQRANRLSGADRPCAPASPIPGASSRPPANISRVVIGRSSPDQLSGPVRIAKMSGAAAALGFAAFVKLAAILSLSLGLMNLLPIPLLDGGHLLFYAIEAARGRPLSRGAQEMALRVGAAFVVSLMVFVTVNDIRSLLPA